MVDGLLAGMAFGLAVLCKPFLLTSVWAVLGAVVYDRMTYRMIRLRHVAAPLVGFMLVVGAWWAFKAVGSQGIAESSRGTLSLYRQNLLFGLGAFGHNAGRILMQPVTLLTLLGTVLAVLLALPLIFRRQYDPPLVVLFLLGLFVTYWWLFFTPGLHARYMWYACAVGGVFCGALLAVSLRQVVVAGQGLGKRVLYAVLACLVLAPALGLTWEQLDRVYLRNEMADDLALAEFVRGLPPHYRIATVHSPLEPSMEFLADRAVDYVQRIPAKNYDIVLVDMETQGPLLEAVGPDLVFGRYGVWRYDVAARK